MMPQEIYDFDQFVQISERAERCDIKRVKNSVKLKLRTPRKLYTLKVKPTEAEGLIKKLRCKIQEV